MSRKMKQKRVFCLMLFVALSVFVFTLNASAEENYFSETKSNKASASNLDIDEELAKELENIAPLQNSTTYTEDTYVSDTTIQGSVYVARDTVVEFSNVTITGNLYVFGTAYLEDVAVNKVCCKKKIEGYDSNYKNGDVFLCGQCDIKSFKVSTYPVEFAPYRIDYCKSINGILSVRGVTVPITDFYINDQKVDLIDGKFVVDIPDTSDRALAYFDWDGVPVYEAESFERIIRFDEAEMDIILSCNVKSYTLDLPDDEILKCSSTNKNVAAVSDNQNIEIFSGGTADLVVVGNKGTYICHVTVVHEPGDELIPWEEPTCTQEGTSFRICIFCKEREYESVAPLGHKLKVVGVEEPTCEEPGVEIYACTRISRICKYEEKVPHGEPLGHDYSEQWTVDKEPTCQETGVKSRHCKRAYCDSSTDSVSIPTIDHSYTSELEGLGALIYEVYSCKWCEHSYKEVAYGYRIAGPTRYETSYKIAATLKETLGIDKFDTIILASGTNFADALSGSYLGKVKNAPIILADNNINKLHTQIAANLKTGGTIYVLGGTAAVSENLIADLKSTYHVVRLGGKDRYETNLKILKEAGVKNEDVLISTGTNFADSLSASSVGKPILLVNGKSTSLTNPQKVFLDNARGKKYILGGEAAISKEIENQLDIEKRIAGVDRYLTSVLIAREFFSDPDVICLASAENFPDGLSGGPLAQEIGAPLILVNHFGTITYAGKYVDDKDVIAAVTFGGTMAVPSNTVSGIIGTDYYNK